MIGHVTDAAQRCLRALLCALGLAALGCGGAEDTGLPPDGELVEPPFAVRGEAEDLLLVWFDSEGLHTAPNRSAIPEAHRECVRVDDLRLPPEERLDPEFVYVADLRRPRDDGSYPVRKMTRAAFDARVEQAAPSALPSAEEGQEPVAAEVSSDVVLYGASWCGACRSAAAFLRSRGIAFVERDIERDPDARAAMQRAVRAAGVSPSGIPVIDFRGRIIQGFDQSALERAIAETSTPI